MASIIKNDQQVKALNEINEALDTVKALNALLNPGVEGAYQLSFIPEKGKAIKVMLGKSEEKNVFAVSTKLREKLIKEIRAKAQKYRIILDQSDLQIIEGEETSSNELAEEIFPDAPSEPLQGNENE